MVRYYLVGGAVRDELLGKTPRERDWLVLGTTAAELLRQGFKPVGKDFPIFLHPRTGEEYALPRGAEGTLSADLQRRDLTINALARTLEGELIDPCGGLADLRARVLRHTGAAFADDPLRILRLARFAAQLPEFTLAPETLDFVRCLVAAGALAHLVAGRIWREWEKALAAQAPMRFLEVLQSCGALAVLAPELAWPAGQAPLAASIAQRADVAQDFAALCLGTGTGLRAVHLCAQLCQRLGTPSAVAQLAGLGLQYRRLLRVGPRKPEQALALLERLDALRRPERWERLLAVQQAGGLAPSCLRRWQQAHAAVLRTPIQPLLAQGLTGLALGAALRAARRAAVAALPD